MSFELTIAGIVSACTAVVPSCAARELSAGGATTVASLPLGGGRAGQASIVIFGGTRRMSERDTLRLGIKAILSVMPFLGCWELCSTHATFIQQRPMTARRKPAKRADPIRAPGWLAILLVVAILCVIGGVLV